MVLGGGILIACGGAFSAALLGQELSKGGQLFMWGANDVGQCGLPAKQPMDVAVPKEVPPLRNTLMRSVACGTSHVMAIDLNGQVYSWGSSSATVSNMFTLAAKVLNSSSEKRVLLAFGLR